MMPPAPVCDDASGMSQIFFSAWQTPAHLPNACSKKKKKKKIHLWESLSNLED